MPKNKTHSGTKKRFRVTGSGKVMREQAGHVHKFHEKTPQKARALSKDVLVSKADVKKVKTPKDFFSAYAFVCSVLPLVRCF